MTDKVSALEAEIAALKSRTCASCEMAKETEAALRAELTAAQQVALSQGIELGALRADNAALRQRHSDADVQYRERLEALRAELARVEGHRDALRDENTALREGRIPASWLAMHAADKRMNDALRADLARARDQYTDLAELLFGEADYEHEDAHRRLSEILGELAGARAVLDTARETGGSIGLAVKVWVNRAAWQAWTEGPRHRYEESEMVVVPVLELFEVNRPIGMLQVKRAALLTTPNFVFALSYVCRDDGGYTLRAVGLISDEDYQDYMSRVTQRTCGAWAPKEEAK